MRAAELSDGHRLDRTCDSPATSFAEPFNNASFPSHPRGDATREDDEEEEEDEKEGG